MSASLVTNEERLHPKKIICHQRRTVYARIWQLSPTELSPTQNLTVTGEEWRHTQTVLVLSVMGEHFLPPAVPAAASPVG